MIYILILAASITSFASVSEDCVDENASEIVSIANSLAIPNCLSQTNYDQAQANDKTPLCVTCKSNFEKKSTRQIPSMPISEKQRLFFNTAMKEFEKNITNNLVEVAKLRAMRPTDSKFEESAKYCTMKSKADFLNDCSSESAKRLITSSNQIDDIISKLPNELAKILATESDYNPDRTLLNRTKSACFVPERDILLHTANAVEAAFPAKLIEAIGKLDSKQFQSVDEIFFSDAFGNNYSGDYQELNASMKSHPLLSQHMSSPESLISFFRTVKSPYSKEALQASLYNKRSGDSFDNKLAESCKTSFSAIKKALCSPQFEDGSINLDAFGNYSKIYDQEFIADDNQLSNSQLLIDKNINFLQLCESSTKNDPLSLKKINDDITLGLDNRYRDLSLQNFKTNKFTEEIGLMNEAICNGRKNDCKDSSILCQIINEMNNPNSAGTRLAKSSNTEINSLLRAMIGSPTRLDPKTREILVLEGILPKSDGTLVAQAEIPERQPGYFNKAPAAAPSAPTTVVSQSQSSKISRSNNGQNSMRNDGGTTFQPTTASSSLTPDFSDLLDQSDSNLRDVQNEIMRRLAALPDKKPASQNQAQQIAHDSLKSRGLTNPSLQNALASRMMAPTTLAPSAPSDSFFENNHKETASSSTKTAAEKYKNDGMNRALAEMHGARTASGAPGSNGRNPASSDSVESADKAISTVALSVPEDPKISLGKVFSEKLNKNDPETQMLKVLVNSKKNFILQVNAVNFRVVFDENKKMNILLDSGDRSEAQRIRPQLEIFFKRLGTI